jgi:adenosylcobalamin-dependent ribonucleoside-triphosphate reductase
MTTDRVIGHQRWLWERAQGDSLSKHQEAELAELRDFFLARMTAPAGRTLWLGGTEVVKRREASNFNPGRRTTRFITDLGVRSFEDFEDGDEVVVLTHAGNWKRAKVVMAGTQPVNKITFGRNRTVHAEYFTPTHTWLLADGTRTDALSVGDRVHMPPATFYDWDYETATPDERYWWAYGFVYGDGTLCKNTDGKPTNSMVRLCGVKAAYLPRFLELGFAHSYPPSCDHDPIVYTGKYLKTLPNTGADLRLVRAFVRGYLDADGCRNRNAARDGKEPFDGIQATSSEACEFIRNYFPAVGLYILTEREISSETNYGVRADRTFYFSLRSDLSGRGSYNGYAVTAIEPQGEEAVWCLVVEDDHSFVLPNGIVTGNCSFLEVRTVHDLVDAFWLLLQGCGVGFKPIAGTLSGFTRKMEVQFIRSTHKIGDPKDQENNTETYDPNTRTWTIKIGDSAEAWAKSIGKLAAGKFPAKKLIIDSSSIRAPGTRLKGYGWICNGDRALVVALEAICGIFNQFAGKLLTKKAIWHIINWLGTVLSNRRSAQIGLIDYGDKEWYDIATMKPPGFDKDERWFLTQSNNSLLFYDKPTRRQLNDLFEMMIANGGAEPGFVNVMAALCRAPWFRGLNPCGEILLADKGFCNLCELDVAAFRGDDMGMHRGMHLLARANYRQTCVNLRDGILQDAWHQNNEFLRLCGTGLTGIVRRPDLMPYDYRRLALTATHGAYGQADELRQPRPANVTTVKPSGTLSKAIFDTTEGAHYPDAQHIINLTSFSRHDKTVEKLLEAGYWLYDHPLDPDSVLAALPVAYDDVDFGSPDGINRETAVSQLERYRMLQNNYVQQNTSITVSYKPEEKKSLVNWFDKNWHDYVACSFLFRQEIDFGDNITDQDSFWKFHCGAAEKRGFSYMPQMAVDKDTYARYASSLTQLDFEQDQDGSLDNELVQECASGACPLR